MDETHIAAQELSGPAPRGFGARVAELLRLALPVTLSRSGTFLMNLVNTILLGHFAATELAYQSIASAVTIPLFVGMSGFILGTLVMTAHANGAGNYAECGAAWRRGLVYATLVGIIAMVLAMGGETVLRVSGLSETLSEEGGKVLRITALGLPFFGIYMTSAYFLEGLKRPNPGMAIIAAANVVNLVLAWALIYGHVGFAPGGAVGSAWATTGVRAFMAVVIVAYIWTLADHERLGVRKRVRVFSTGGWRAWAEQRRIGYSAGVSQAVESSAFSLLTIIAGLVGTVALAAYSIAFQLLGVIFMIALGFGSATGVLVAHAWGRRDAAEMKRAGWLGVGVDLVIVTAAAALIGLFAEPIAGIFTADPALLAAAVPLIVLMALVIVPDHAQAVMAHALRGRGDTWIPTATHFISYFVVMAPLSWLLAITLGGGTSGIMQAVLIASVLSAAFLFVRFYLLSKRPLS